MVLIIGAGFSGLHAAVLLKRRGISVTVIEARDRIGGRVYTKSKNGLIYEMGGEWLGTKDPLILKACEDFGLELVDHELKTQFLYRGKHYLPDQMPIDERWLPHVKELVEKFSDLSDEEVQHLQRINWHEFLLQADVPDKDIDLMNLARSTDFGEDMRFIPAYDVLYDYMVGGDGPTACAKSIKGGNVLFAEKCVEEIGAENVHLNQEVRVIKKSDEGVEVVCKGGTTYKGDLMIVAVPPQAVREIEWIPALPVEQVEAFFEIEYCRIAKTAAYFSTRFWPDQSFELMTDLLPQQIYHSTPGQLASDGILTSYAVGDRAHILSHMSESDQGKEIQKVLQAASDSVVPVPDSVDSYYWGEDPYTGGAYPCFSGDQHLRLQPLFRAPQENIFFAGEHTARRYGFMEGAIEAGERAVSEVLRKLNLS